jgi:hypothetical protein
MLDSVSPRFGTVEGGTELTYTGSNFGSVVADVTVLLDDIECSVTSVTDTEIKCTTGSRPGLRNTT